MAAAERKELMKTKSLLLLTYMLVREIDNKQTYNIIINNNQAHIVSVRIRVKTESKTSLENRDWRRENLTKYLQKAYLIMLRLRADLNELSHAVIWEECIPEQKFGLQSLGAHY